MRKFWFTVFFLAATPISNSALASNFSLYPGFQDKNSFVEMTTDKGLVIEIVLRCDRENGKVIPGIMTYSKVEKLFCSSKMMCTKDADLAADDTCGY